MNSLLFTQNIFHSFIILFLCTKDIIYGVPDDYCFGPLNHSDCNKSPSKVFTYYNPGSRCELQVWRGCPTNNKFEDQVNCSEACVGKMFNNINDHYNPCDYQIVTENCGGEETKVYTFNKKTMTCVPVIWRGCKSVNKFNTTEECYQTCMSDVFNFIKDLNSSDLVDYDDIIDNFESTSASSVTPGEDSDSDGDVPLKQSVRHD